MHAFLLLLQVMRGDQTNFVHADELLASWRIFTPVLHDLRAQAVVPEPYAFGSPGPVAAERAFAARFGFSEGFRHGLDDDKRRQAIAWGKTTTPSHTPPASRLASRAGSAAGSSAGSEDGGRSGRDRQGAWHSSTER